MAAVEDLGSRSPGRPRSVEADEAILDAALEEYAVHGYDRLTTDGVAARAGVSKATIYRRYGSKLELVTAAMYRTSDHKPYPDTGSLERDLRTILDHLGDLVNDPVLGSCLRHMAADSITAPDLGEIHNEFVAERRAGTKQVLQRWVDRGELRAGTDLDLANDLLTGPVFYRHLMSHMRVDRRFLDGVCAVFLRAFAA
jgi:AcrR family transcriptional regulator